MLALESVRAAVLEVEQGLPSAAVVSSGEGISRTLRTSMELLLDTLRLALLPPRTACPHCGALGMLEATRCGSCWRPLTPRPSAGPGPEGAP